MEEGIEKGQGRITELAATLSTTGGFIFIGLFVVNGNEILYSQETHITFWCPMRFDNFPLDSQVCKFKVIFQSDELNY